MPILRWSRISEGLTPVSSARSRPMPVSRAGAVPLTEGRKPTAAVAALWVFVLVPFAALAAAIPVAWEWGLSWTDVAIAATAYVLTGLGVTVGFHRYLTHGAFKARRWLRIGLAVAGTLAVQGSVIGWVADHRRHHAFADHDGDPHSPWRYGCSVRGLAKGLLFAHVGWMLGRDRTNPEHFAKDLLNDGDIRRVDRLFGPLVAASLLLPPVIGLLATGTWRGAVTAFFWGSLVRIALLHHVTWSINSICHVFGERPLKTRAGDRAANFWPLAIVSFGESWHNGHHADPTCARHGVLPGQIDISARLIRLLERFGWVRDVRWPTPARLAARRREPSS
ncbi:acyl-CoA desaturase [Microbispora bryophytorum]|uniref:Stearoyl-CoA desaturase n=1 Tax=Microbispora bryophytorum TaxID=1460882 RepID=A0A8H9L9Q6_9ACTN|nr:acyl-CoA desaturase [Microbispora bryophytorum]GGO08341.1 stearoyl-CoA desaturase [Microbispora bryophytorum]